MALGATGGRGNSNSRLALGIVLGLVVTAAITGWGPATNAAEVSPRIQANEIVDNIRRSSSRFPRVLWRPSSCIAGSELINPGKVKLCVGSACGTGNAIAPTFVNLREREVALRRRSENQTVTDDAFSVVTCVMHRSGEWFDADTNAPVTISSSQLVERGDALRRRWLKQAIGGCNLEEWLTASSRRQSTSSCDSNDDERLSTFDTIALLHTITHTKGEGGDYILFSGDSMLRQIHARLVQLIRNIPPPIMEHTSLGEVTYLVRATGDELIVRSRLIRGGASHKSGKSGATKRAGPLPSAWPFVLSTHNDSAVLARVDFTWQATLGEYDPFRLVAPVFKRAAMNSTIKYLYPTPVFHIHGFMFWNGGDFNETRMLQRWESKMNDIAQHVWGVNQSGSLPATAQWIPSTFISVTTPPLETGEGYSGSNVPMNNFLRRRNALLRSWTSALVERLHWTAASNFTTLTFDVESIVEGLVRTTNSTNVVDQRGYQGQLRNKRKDDKHFMCTADPKLPTPVSLIRVDRNDCRDEVNAELVRRLLAAMLLRTTYLKTALST